ncbi:hypothetical protein BTE77_35515 [Ensifer adhaerens]|nr:hypothetical protein BTE77_35515 [Ensifer adhaerens]
MRRTYSQIDMDERRRIARWRAAGLSVTVIAEKLGRHRSTIFRELSRNAFEDLIQFRKKFGKANVTSLVERVSRFAVFLRNNDRQSKPIMDGLIQALQSLPHLARRSITFDRGTEFSEWPYLQAGIGTQTWFCDPQSPWQKGTVENTNRRARKWLSREVDPLSITDGDLKDICDRLNSTPRKCLGYRTPAEVFRKKLLAQMRRVG